jgi:3-hydroxyisobutyrate dehydrogenase-like beta-hydroxyacid dehydrogenase
MENSVPMPDTAVHNPARPRTGVLGLGAMGAPIARHLLAAGVPVTVLDRDAEVAAAAARSGADVAADLPQLAAECPVVLVLLPTDADVLEACASEDGLLASAQPGRALVICSSVRPSTCEQVAAAAPAGVSVLDAALTGGLRAAEAGDINLLVGGDGAALDRVRPVLEPWTSGIHLLGPLGAGQVAKTANNLMHWAQIAAITESFELARRHGVDPQDLRRALVEGPTDSRTLRELEDFRFTWYEKDIENAVRMAADVDWPLPGAERSLHAMRRITVDKMSRLLRGEDPQLG